jgi:hypothetical protein
MAKRVGISGESGISRESGIPRESVISGERENICRER